MELTEKDWDEIHDKANAFSREFKALVRKYVPEPTMKVEGFKIVSVDHFNSTLLAMMQDRTSVYCPYVWSDED